MAIKSLINGKPRSEISLQDRGLQYGDGLFETIAVENENLLCWDEHINRLQQGCDRLNIPSPERDSLKDEASRLITSTEPSVIKIIITRGQGGRGYALPEKTEPTRIISLYPWPDHPHENAITGVNVRACHYRYAHNPALVGIKHLNRLEQIMARSEWSDDSIAEGIVLDYDNNVIEGTMSNIFYMANGTLHTPDLSHCGIDGIIRQKIIELAAVLDCAVCIKDTSLETLIAADEIFICNSIIGVWPINRIDDKSFVVGEKTNQIKQALQKRSFIPTLC
jgi:4-amino-4-deoxychorismate lyase